MTTRDDILARVRRHQPSPTPLPSIPAFDAPARRNVDAFKAAVTRMGGKVIEARATGDLTALVRHAYSGAKVICSATAEVSGTRPLDPRQRPATLEDVDVGVVRARFGVAETGSIFLTEKEFKVSALGFLSQHLVALLDPDRIVGNLHDAYRELAQLHAGYSVFMTGPSATADIEGVLIHGAQGIRTLTIVLAAAR